MGGQRDGVWTQAKGPSGHRHHSMDQLPATEPHSLVHQVILSQSTGPCSNHLRHVDELELSGMVTGKHSYFCSSSENGGEEKLDYYCTCVTYPLTHYYKMVKYYRTVNKMATQKHRYFTVVLKHKYEYINNTFSVL